MSIVRAILITNLQSSTETVHNPEFLPKRDKSKVVVVVVVVVDMVVVVVVVVAAAVVAVVVVVIVQSKEVTTDLPKA